MPMGALWRYWFVFAHLILHWSFTVSSQRSDKSAFKLSEVLNDEITTIMQEEEYYKSAEQAWIVLRGKADQIFCWYLTVQVMKCWNVIRKASLILSGAGKSKLIILEKFSTEITFSPETLLLKLIWFLY